MLIIISILFISLSKFNNYPLVFWIDLVIFLKFVVKELSIFLLKFNSLEISQWKVTHSFFKDFFFEILANLMYLFNIELTSIDSVVFSDFDTHRTFSQWKSFELGCSFFKKFFRMWQYFCDFFYGRLKGQERS
jgi:hypothetical protein